MRGKQGMVNAILEANPGTEQVLRPLISQGRVHLVDIRGAHAVDLRVLIVQKSALILYQTHVLTNVTVLLRMDPSARFTTATTTPTPVRQKSESAGESLSKAQENRGDAERDWNDRRSL